jgi:hypothetical protein
MVITGFSGGEMASRGKVKAFSARDGKHVWTFNTVPGPAELGHDTWPQDSNAWQFGGAPVWQTPAVDVDAQRMEEGALAVVKLPFRLRGGTHVNWFSADELAAQRADTV